MAISVEKVYSGTNEQVYPETSDGAVIVNLESYSNWTLQTYLENLEDRISKLGGAESLAKSLHFKIEYLATDSSVESEAKANTTQWTSVFQLPTTDAPYIWKRTTIYYDGQEESSRQKIYEIVASDTAEISQTLYMVGDNTKQPTIIYPQIATESGNVNDTNASLDDIIKASNKNGANSWSKTPISITSAAPYSFIAVRNRTEGKWGTFQVAVNARWSYDSIITMKYTVTSTSDTPSVTRNNTNPGDIWVDSNTSDFTGYLWMINATQSNNNLVADDSGYFWSTPQLISIVK